MATTGRSSSITRVTTILGSGALLPTQHDSPALMPG